MRKDDIEKLEIECRIQRIKESKKFIFELFHSDRIRADIRPFLTLAFCGGLLLIAHGKSRVGEFIAGRALHHMIRLTDGVQTKVQKAWRLAKTNPQLFARAVASNAEINREFRDIGHKDEIELLEAQLNEE